MNTTTQGAPALIDFPFSKIHVRACLIEDQCWFVARDIFNALEISWRGKESLLKIKEDWRGVRRFRTPSEIETGRGGGDQDLLIIAEPAVYKIAFRSDKEEAERFTDHIAEIVTTIRKTGGYSIQQTGPSPSARIPLTREELRAIQASFDNISRFIRHHTSAKTASAIYVPLHSRFGITSIKDMSAADLPAVLLLLETLGKDAHTFYMEQCERESKFLGVMGRNILPMPVQQELMAA